MTVGAIPTTRLSTAPVVHVVQPLCWWVQVRLALLFESIYSLTFNKILQKVFSRFSRSESNGPSAQTKEMMSYLLGISSTFSGAFCSVRIHVNSTDFRMEFPIVGYKVLQFCDANYV